MSTDSLENAPTEPVKRKRGRPPGSRSHANHTQRVLTSREELEAAVRALAIVVGLEETFNAATLVAMTDQMLENAIRELVHAKFGTSNGDAVAATPDANWSAENEVQTLRMWCSQRSAYYKWGAEDLDRLKTALNEKYRGATVIPQFAHSCALRLVGSNRVILVNRQGFEVLS